MAMDIKDNNNKIEIDFHMNLDVHVFTNITM